MAKRGRPTKYTKKLAEVFCERIALGQSLRKVCEADDMPAPKTIFQWMRKYEDFGKQYARACQERSEAQIEELHDLGDEAIDLARRVDPKASGAVVQAVRLKADNIKWAASKMKPQKYGEKIDLTSGGEKVEVAPLVVSKIKARRGNANPEAKPAAGS